MTTKDEERKLTILLKEYETCQASVQQLDSAVWQSAALIGSVSIGTLALVATEPASIPVIILLGAFSTTASFIWWRMANRWWSIQTAKIRRMRHIEEELPTRGQTHYVDFLDDLHRGRSSKPVDEKDPRVAELAKAHSLPIERARLLAHLEHERSGPRELLRGFRWATLAAWAIFLALRILPTIARAVSLILLSLGWRIVPGA
jgi:hypothetical protein